MLEVHGSIHWLQCQARCNDRIWRNEEVFQIDETTMRACDPLPRCAACGRVCRPNILMFDDHSWLQGRVKAQNHAFDRFLKANAARKIAVVELGAGTAIPTIRITSERIGRKLKHASVIRINPREPRIGSPHLSIGCGALEGLQRIDNLLQLPQPRCQSY